MAKSHSKLIYILITLFVTATVLLLSSCGSNNPLSTPKTAVNPQSPNTSAPAAFSSGIKPLPKWMDGLPPASISCLLANPNLNLNATGPIKPFDQLCGNYFYVESYYSQMFVPNPQTGIMDFSYAWWSYQQALNLNGIFIRVQNFPNYILQSPGNPLPTLPPVKKWTVPCDDPCLMGGNFPKDAFTGNGAPNVPYIGGDGSIYTPGGAPTPPPPASEARKLLGVMIDPDVVNIKIAETATFSGTAIYSKPPVVQEITSMITSGDTAIATISNGVVTGVASGQAALKVTFGGYSAVSVVDVGNASGPKTLTNITINPSTQTVGVGQTASFSAIAHYSDGSAKDVTANSSTLWSTQISGFPNTNPPGTAVAYTAPVTTTSGNKNMPSGLSAPSGVTPPTALTSPPVQNGIVSSQTKATVIVKADYTESGVTKTAQGTAIFDNKYTALSITPSKATIYIHNDPKTQTFTAKGVLPSGTKEVINNNDVNWTSSDTNIATIDANGLSTAGSPGTVNIHAAFVPDSTLFSNPDAELNIECRIYTQYQQNAGPWATQLYAYHKSPWFIPPLWTVGQVGCAVTSSAMALSGNGTHIDPGWLDTMMTTPSTVVNVYGTQNLPVYTFYDTGNGVNFTLALSYFGNVTATGIKFNQDQWINYLNSCKTIIARVHNTRDHYIFIYKYSNGNFIAYDPLYPGEQVIDPARIIDGILCSY